MESLVHYIDIIAKVVETLGVLIMFLGLLLALIKAAKATLVKGSFSHETYLALRQGVGKSILLGLEVLIAADIMATVVTTPTLRSVVVLGAIVLIRTFLSLSLQVELEGRFPWQKEVASPDSVPPKPIR